MGFGLRFTAVLLLYFTNPRPPHVITQYPGQGFSDIQSFCLCLWFALKSRIRL